MIKYILERTTVPTFTATIYLGTKYHYTGEEVPPNTVYDFIQKWVDEIGMCVTVDKTFFQYTKGQEHGFRIGFINYPRFPSTPEKIKEHALDLAEKLIIFCKQYRVTIVCTDETIMISNTQELEKNRIIMSAGNYIRTPDIRKKQSEKMKGRPSKLKGYKNSKITGRPKTSKRWQDICLCGKSFTQIEHKEKKYCSQKCYLNSKKGKPWFFGIIDRSYMQTEAYSLIMRNPETPEFVRYKNKVHRLSHKIYEQFKDELNPQKLLIARCGVKNGYQIDHIITVRFGFDNHISEEEISKKENLRIIPWRDNLGRNKKCQ